MDPLEHLDDDCVKILLKEDHQSYPLIEGAFNSCPERLTPSTHTIQHPPLRPGYLFCPRGSVRCLDYKALKSFTALAGFVGHRGYLVGSHAPCASTSRLAPRPRYPCVRRRGCREMRGRRSFKDQDGTVMLPRIRSPPLTEDRR
jgi:hypothetical protein